MGPEAVQLVFDYSYWAASRILAAAHRLEPTQFTTAPPLAGAQSLRHILVHVLDCELGWREALQANAPSSTPELDPGAFPDVETLTAAWRDDEAIMRDWLSGLDDSTLATRMFTGRLLWEHLLHVTNHSTQHRSEAAMLLTGFGRSPGDLDLALYLRDKSAS